MADQAQAKKVDIDKLLSLADDMLKLLNTNKDGHALLQSCHTAATILSKFRSSSNHLRASIQDCQRKVDACKQDVVNVKNESVPGDELVRLHKELEEINKAEESLLEELRDVTAKIEQLDHQRIFIEEKKGSNNQKQKNMVQSKKVLSMCASVTNIVPNLYNQDKISGYILDKNRKRVKSFEFENDDFDACNNLWEMLSK